jgi:hypothetical protein
MGKQSTAWKSLEHKAAGLFGGVRVTRGENFSLDRPDVLCEKRWSIECKSRTKLTLWGWYAKLKVDTDKFFPGENRIKVLVTKEKGKRGELISLSSEDFFKIIDPKYKKEIAEMAAKIESKEIENGKG